MNLFTFVVDKKELIATAGSLFVAVLGVVAATIGRRRYLILTHGNEPPPNANRRVGMPSAARQVDLKSAREEVRAAEEELLRRNTRAREARPPLSLTVQNRLLRELAHDPECNLSRLCYLAADVPADTFLLYLERLADVERTWREVVAARGVLYQTAPAIEGTIEAGPDSVVAGLVGKEC